MALIAPPPNVKSFSLPPLRHHRPTVFSGVPTRYENTRILGYKYNGRRRAAMQVVMMSAAATTSVSSDSGEESSGFGRILLSDVVVKRRNKVYWGREWNSQDIATGAVVVAMHFLCLVAPFVFNWAAFWVAFGLYIASGLFGITLSFHRNLTHRSFKLPKWLEYFFAYCGVQALQGNPIDWVSTHRYHHQHCDSERDPHSPFEGFWFSYMSWMFDTDTIEKRCGERNNVGDLEKQPFYKFIQSIYILHPLALGLLLYAIGGFPFIVWGMGVRIAWVYHITWLVNSACHVWGRQAFNTGDLSRNNWWVALLAFGEGWHNNHHAFEYSARHGLEWWQFDTTWYVVRFLQLIGLATDVKIPNEAQKQIMAFPSKICWQRCLFSLFYGCTSLLLQFQNQILGSVAGEGLFSFA